MLAVRYESIVIFKAYNTQCTAGYISLDISINITSRRKVGGWEPQSGAV